MVYFDPWYFVAIAPALLLAMWAQIRVKSAYAAASQEPAGQSGAQAARQILDAAHLYDVAIEQTPGHLSDHYDPQQKVLRLSPEVYNGRSMAAVGIAAHEAGHAIQDAERYAPLVIRNAAVPAANFGSGLGIMMIIFGALMQLQPLIWVGIVAFAAVVFFQLVNLPVEFDASNRAKKLLVGYGIVNQYEMEPVNRVLNAAAWTYVAATLQAVMILLYYILRFGNSNRD